MIYYLWMLEKKNKHYKVLFIIRILELFYIRGHFFLLKTFFLNTIMNGGMPLFRAQATYETTESLTKFKYGVC